MGTAGNRPGFKVYSISTTIRNPRRNTEFLEVLKDFNKQELNSKTKEKIYFELIRRGIYQVNKLDNYIKEKYEENILLTDSEIIEITERNPQRTGNQGRLMTQIRALKDTGLLTLTGKRNSPILEISSLGQKLLDNDNIENVYSKAMIGLHANNPQRTTIYNESRPFLNLLFVINELNKRIENNKGILWHEFAFFVLPMKDCDYKKATDEIIKYRNLYKHERNKKYLENYIYNEIGVNEIKYDSILKDYADDVYRKFSMTGLVYTHGFGNNMYISFTPYYIEKVKSILKEYEGYKFLHFNTTAEYMEYLNNINLPWENSDEIKKQIIEKQKEMLNVEVSSEDSLDTQMEKLNNIYNKRVFETYVENISKEKIIRELVLLSRNENEKSEFNDVPNALKLEWFIAMLTAKIYGTSYVNPNLILDTNGIPKSFAPGGKADIEFNTDDLYCLIEVTLMRDYKQQLNSETTSIADHLNELNMDKNKCSLLIAPIIHHRVASYFQYITNVEDTTIVASTIEHYINSIKDNTSTEEFVEFINNLRELLVTNKNTEYCDKINSERVKIW